MILCGFCSLFKNFSSSSSDRVSGDSIEIFMRYESVASPRRFLNRVFFSVCDRTSTISYSIFFKAILKF